MTVGYVFFEFIGNYLQRRLSVLVTGTWRLQFWYVDQHLSDFRNHNVIIVAKQLENQLDRAGHVWRKSNNRSTCSQIIVKFDPVDVTPFNVRVLIIR